jgi:uncharacterized protein (DUF302 family)
MRQLLQTITTIGFIGLSTMSAADSISYTVDDQSYDDVMFGLENAIVDRGLVISNHNHVGEMLARTAADLGADSNIFTHADILGFCSAELSRAAMAADPMNIQFCPYNIFMYQEAEDGAVTIGFNDLPDTPEMQAVEDLLNSITREAAGLD